MAAQRRRRGSPNIPQHRIMDPHFFVLDTAPDPAALRVDPGDCLRCNNGWSHPVHLTPGKTPRRTRTGRWTTRRAS